MCGQHKGSFPSDEELKERYKSLDENKDLTQVLNWKDPSFAKERAETAARKRKPCDNVCEDCDHIRC